MDVKRAIREENARHNRFMQNVARAEDFADCVDFVNGDTIFCSTAGYDQNMNLLRNFREEYGKSRLKYYYMSDSELCVVYSFQDFDLSLYFEDADHAIEKLSGGGCKIVSQLTENLKVVCDVN